MSRPILPRRLLAGLAAATLACGLVACADGADDATFGDTPVETTQDIDDAPADDPEGGTEPVQLLDGQMIDLPAALSAGVDTYSFDFGAPIDVEEQAGRYLVSFDQGNYLVYSLATDAQPIGGEIAETWLAEGGIDAEIGLPVAEESITDRQGRAQNFENGTITVNPDEPISLDVDQSIG